MQVYPAANLIYCIGENVPIYFIDPKPNVTKHHFKNLTVITKPAINGMERLLQILEK